MLFNQSCSRKFNLNLLIGIILIAALLRIPFLATIPNGFFVDEAANGYEAYAILNTLHDSNGKLLPLFLQAVDDYRTALYAYITIPSIKIFGLNEFATRLPAAIVGILTVLVLYLLVQEIFNQQVGLFAALLLAISPWHVQFSRVAFEAILYPFFFCLALLCFFKGLKQAKYLLVSAALFGLCLCTYFSARVFIPLFTICLISIFRKDLWRKKRETLIAGLILTIFFVFLIRFFLSTEGMARVRAVGIVTDPLTLLQNYLSYFSPSFLFLSGDPNLRHSTQKLGELYLFESITILAGVLFLLTQNRKQHCLLLCWLFLYPIPAFFTQAEHAIRAIIGAPLFAFLSAYGINGIMTFISQSYRKTYKIVLIWLVILSLTIFLNYYFLIYPKYSSEAWQFGAREAINYTESRSNICVIVSSRVAYPMSYFILFYTQYSPQVYQRSPISVFTAKNFSLGKYHVAVAPATRFQNRELGQQLISIWQQQLSDRCLFIIKLDEMKAIVESDYKWRQVYAVKNPNGVEVIKLVQLTR